jgi:hypothetical protein
MAFRRIFGNKLKAFTHFEVDWLQAGEQTRDLLTFTYFLATQPPSHSGGTRYLPDFLHCSKKAALHSWLA